MKLILSLRHNSGGKTIFRGAKCPLCPLLESVCGCGCVCACVCICPCMSVYVCAFCVLYHFLLWFGCQGTGPASQPVSGPTNLENPTHPILPKRVTYYQASFDRTTTVSQVSIEGKILQCSNHFNAMFYSHTVV